MATQTMTRGFRPGDPELHRIWNQINTGFRRTPPGLTVDESIDGLTVTLPVEQFLNLWLLKVPLPPVPKTIRITRHHVRLWDGRHLYPCGWRLRWQLLDLGISREHTAWLVDVIDRHVAPQQEPDEEATKLLDSLRHRATGDSE